jgi:hypothetical protein
MKRRNMNPRVIDNIDEEVAKYLDGNNLLKVEFILEHLEQVQIFPDKVIVIVPLLNEGIVVNKIQYVSGEKWSRKNNLNANHGYIVKALEWGYYI